MCNIHFPNAMRQILFGLMLALAALIGPATFSGEQAPIVEIPEHGLGLLLDTPNSPVGDIDSERNVLT